MSSTIKLSQLINTCVVLSQTAGSVVRQKATQAGLQVIQKSNSYLDVCTEADLRIQKNLHYNLKALYPKAKIICEEDEDLIRSSNIEPSILPDQVLSEIKQQGIFKEKSMINAAKRRRTQFKRHLHSLSELSQEYAEADDVKTGLENPFTNEVYEEELTFWIDPLDGSSGFAEGHTEHLTCIIGVSIKNRPKFGVLFKPFSEFPYPSNGRSFVGIPECGLYVLEQFQDIYGQKQIQMPRLMPDFNHQIGVNDSENFIPRILGSMNKNQTQMDNLINTMNPSHILRVAGSGNKFIQITKNRADFYANLVPGFKKWDMCGSEAILLSRLGIVSDASRRPLDYSSEGSHTLKEGIVAAKSKQILEICEERVVRNTGFGFQHFNNVISQEALKHKMSRGLKELSMA